MTAQSLIEQKTKSVLDPQVLPSSLNILNKLRFFLEF